MLRRGFDGVTMELRWGFEGIRWFFPLFLQSLLPARPPCHPPFLAAFLVVPLKTLPISKRYTPFAAQILPPAAPEPAIQSAFQPGTNFPDEPNFFLSKPPPGVGVRRWSLAHAPPPVATSASIPDLRGTFWPLPCRSEERRVG